MHPGPLFRMKELTVILLSEKNASFQSQWKELAEKDSRLEVVQADMSASPGPYLERAEGRYVMLAGEGIEPVRSNLPVFIDVLEETDVDVVIAGYTGKTTEEGEAIHIPASASAGRQIDVIKLLDKYEDVEDCLRYSCLIYNLGFLKDTGICFGAGRAAVTEYQIMPFTSVSSVMMIPEAITDQEESGPPVIRPEDIDTLKRVIDHYASHKPMGKARDEFIRRMITSLTDRMYEALLLKNTEDEPGSAAAAELTAYIEKKDAALYKNTMKSYKRYSMLSRSDILTRLYGKCHKW